MLALMTVADAGGARTLVFDEVDAGIGGQTARAVGERLRALADARQVICITHLPQIASLAESHFRIAKDAGPDVARTSVEALDGGQVVEELVPHARRRHDRRGRACATPKNCWRRRDRCFSQRAGSGASAHWLRPRPSLHSPGRSHAPQPP